MTPVRLPRLLGADMAETARLRPTAYTPSLRLRETSYAQMTLPDSAPAVAMHDWMELYTQRGSIGLFRVTNIVRTEAHDITLTLRHAIDTLSDGVWRAQLDYDGDVPGFLATLLAQQPAARWQLGTCADTSAYKRAGINYTRLSDLLWELADARRAYYFDYDLTTTPWTLNMLALPTEPSAEIRLSRNVQTAQITRDDADMCNRLHVSVNTQTTVDSVTTNAVELRTYNDAASQAVYGVIEKTADIDTVDVADPDAWAADQLARRSEPSVQITIEGYELAAQTGDSWDEMSRGRLVRCVLRDMGTVVNERVEGVTYPDALGQPERVTVELANRLPKFSETIAGLQQETARLGGAARGAARSAASADQLEHWAMIVTEQAEALDGTGLMELWETGIVLDPVTGATIYSLNQGFESQHAAINVNAQAIVSEAARAQQVEGGLSTGISRVEQTADSVSAEVTNARDGESSLSARLGIMAGEITSKVSAGDIASTINQTAQSVLIQAGKIDLQGYVTASQLSATNAEITNLKTGQTVATALKATLLQADSAFNFAGTNMHLITLSCGGTSLGVMSSANANVALTHYHAFSVSESNGVVSLTLGTDQHNSPGTQTFNIADTTFYQNAVASAYAEGYADGEDGVQITGTVYTGSWSSTGERTVTAYYRRNGGSYTFLDSATISMPSSPTSFSVTVDGPSGAHGTYVASVTVNGKTYATSGNWQS